MPTFTVGGVALAGSESFARPAFASGPGSLRLRPYRLINATVHVPNGTAQRTSAIVSALPSQDHAYCPQPTDRPTAILQAGPMPAPSAALLQPFASAEAGRR